MMKYSDKFNLVEHLALNEGAYFFRKGEIIIDDDTIKDVFGRVLEDIEYNVFTNIVRKEIVLGEVVKILYSLLIFKFTTIPSFLDFNEGELPNKLSETKFAYLLIVEIEDFIVIVKKNISHITPFINILTPISADILSGVLVEDETLFQQIK